MFGIEGGGAVPPGAYVVIDGSVMFGVDVALPKILLYSVLDM
jgi:hypothetical protein